MSRAALLALFVAGCDTAHAWKSAEKSALTSTLEALEQANTEVRLLRGTLAVVRSQLAICQKRSAK